MPTFGDFETFGEPLANTEERGHVSTVWRARKLGNNGDPVFAIKCYAPHRTRSKGGDADETLDRDRGLEFIEGIKHFKKAHSEGGRCLAPIHAFGIAEVGAWFVTDYFPRNTLKAWVAKKGNVDSAALRRVVQDVVTGCLALKRSRGYSHGNLKATNVFLVGKPRPLRSTPLQLADAYPAAPLQLARLDGQEKQTVDELLHQVMEVQDLRALGELLLQLVEGRLVTSAYDYNYPIANSPDWERLGRDGKRYLDLCNRLLDPQLSLDRLSLESLAKETKTGGGEAGKLLKIAAVIAAVGVLGASGFLVVKKVSGSNQEKVARHIGSAREALKTTNWVEARREIADALKLGPANPDAVALSGQIGEAAQTELGEALRVATNSFIADIRAAETNLSVATNSQSVGLQKVKTQLARAESAALPGNPTVSDCQRKLRDEQEVRDNLRQAQNNFNASDWQGVSNKLTQVLSKQPANAWALQLQRNLREKFEKLTEAQKLTQYVDALKEATNAWNLAKAAFDQRKYGDAVTQYDDALKKCGEAENLKVDSRWQELKKALTGGRSTAETRRTELLGQQQQYVDALKEATNAWNLAKAAFDQRKYGDAVTQYDDALKKCGEAENLKVDSRWQELKKALTGGRSTAETRRTELLGQQQQYVDALKEATNAWNLAKAAFDQRKYGDAVTQYDDALKKCGEAENLKVDSRWQELKKALTGGRSTAETRRTELLGQQQQYVDALKEATNAWNLAKAAFDQRKYGDAVTQYDDALKKCGEAENLKVDSRWQELKKALTGGRSTAETRRTELLGQQQQYVDALKEATNAWNLAKAAFDQRKYGDAVTQYDDALKKCKEAEGLNVGTDWQGLETEVKRLRGSAEMKGDFELASKYRNEGNYEKALEPRSKYNDDAEFKMLRDGVTAEKEAYLDVTSRYKIGDYTFLTGSAVKYAGKPNFKLVWEKGSNEYQSLTNLTSLTNQMGNSESFQKLQQGLARLDASYANKPPFATLRALVEAEKAKQAEQLKTIAKALDDELYALQIQWNVSPKIGKGRIKVPDRAVLGRYQYIDAGKDADILNDTPEATRAFYRAAVDDLSKRFEVAQILDAKRKEFIQKLKAAIK